MSQSDRWLVTGDKIKEGESVDQPADPSRDDGSAAQQQRAVKPTKPTWLRGAMRRFYGSSPLAVSFSRLQAGIPTCDKLVGDEPMADLRPSW